MSVLAVLGGENPGQTVVVCSRASLAWDGSTTMVADCRPWENPRASSPMLMQHVTKLLILFGLLLTSCSQQSSDPASGGGFFFQECSAATDCDDENPCTIDRCLDGECVHDSIVCEDPSFVCDVDTGSCVCDEDNDCDDGEFCNGVESCFDGVCLSGEPPCIGVQECDEAEGYCFTPLEAIQTATWLVLASSDWSGFIATAFGVTDDLFATNAHVTEALKNLFGEPNAQALLFQHETGAWRAITEVWTHPSYDANHLAGTPDVGLLRAAPTGSEPGSFEPLFLAEDAELSNLQVFDEVSICGFPADVTGVFDLPGLLAGTIRPRTTCLQGTISALRPFDPLEPATPDNTFLIQYDLPIVGGTSGSAVFNSRGTIIGVNSFGFTTGGDFNFAIRIDILSQLVPSVESGQIEGVLLDDIELNVPPCQTSYFNSEWQFGFDLPSGFNEVTLDPLADPILFAALFAKTNQPEGNILAIVIDSSSLEEVYMADLEYYQETAAIITTTPFVTANGVPAFFTIALVPDDNSSEPLDDFYHYIVHTAGVSGVYQVLGATRLFNVPAIGSILEDATLSLCTEWARTASSNQPRLSRGDSSGMDRASYMDLLSEAADHFGNVIPASGRKSKEE